MPESQDEFDEAWARIVDDLTSESHGSADGADPADSSPPGSAQDLQPRPEPRPDTPSATSDAGLDALFEPLRRHRPRPAPEPKPDDFLDDWEDEGHFVPPPPPEIPEGTPIKRLAWAGVIGGPLALLLIAFTGWAPPDVVGFGAGLAALAGFATLVWHLPENREDGWDDGARL